MKNPVMLGVALTNRPFLELDPVTVVKSVEGREVFKIPVIKLGNYSHPKGDLDFNSKAVQKLVDNFYKKVGKSEVSVDLTHKPDQGAVGWVKDVAMEGGVLYAYANPNGDDDLNLVKKGKFKYASIEFHPNYTSNVKQVYLSGDLIVNKEKAVEEINQTLDEKVLLLEGKLDEVLSKLSVQEEEVVPPDDKEARIFELERALLSQKVDIVLANAKAYRDSNGCGHAPVFLDMIETILRGNPVGEAESQICLEDTQSASAVNVYLLEAMDLMLRTIPGSVKTEPVTEVTPVVKPQDVSPQEDARIQGKKDAYGFWSSKGGN